MLEVANLEVVYHSVVLVLRGVSLRVDEGSIVALLGPNGAGKTTTLRAITGLLDIHEGRTTKGKIHFRGESLLDSRPDEIVDAGVVQVMEGRRIFADLSVDDNMLAASFARRDRAGVRREREQLYERFPVLGRRRRQLAGLLSGGEQQMLAVARALMLRPRLLVLDEPSLGLAPKLVTEVAELIREINAQGTSILLVEQNASVALNLAGYGYVMENGKIVVDGTAEELKADRDIQEFYLGLGGGQKERSFRDVKLYRRKKRWLS